MDKKQVLALVLISILIITWPYYQEMVGGGPVASKPASQDSTVVAEKVEEVIQKEPEQIKVSEEKRENVDTEVIEHNEFIQKQVILQDSLNKTYKINSDKIDVVLSNKGGGSLKRFALLKYAMDDSLVNMVDSEINNDLYFAFQTNNGDFINTEEFIFFSDKNNTDIFLEEGDTYSIEFSLKIKGETVKKIYTFYGDSYHFDVKVVFSNPSKTLLNREYQFGWQNGLPSTESYKADDNNYKQAYVYMGDELENFDVTDEGKSETVTLSGSANWVAVRTKYFLGSISNIENNTSEGVYFSGEGIKKEDYVQRIYDVGFNARYEKDTGDTRRIYLGPMDHKELEKYENNLDVLIMNNGWYERVFRFFSLIVLWVLEFLHSFIPNYGVVIIVFSVLIKLAVYPLTKKSYTSMKEMQKIAPLQAELKEKYKGDPQRLNKETMELYKKHGVNPMGGCLPTLIQMPLLIALFIVFRSTIQLRGAMFIPGWVPDLSRADTIFMLPFSLPMYGDSFNLLPILMAVTMLFQSKMTMQDPKQKAMVYMMPVFMLLIFNRFPSGLNLYYTLFNLLTIIQQKLINKSHGDPEPVQISKKTQKKKR